MRYQMRTLNSSEYDSTYIFIDTTLELVGFSAWVAPNELPEIEYTFYGYGEALTAEELVHEAENIEELTRLYKTECLLLGLDPTRCVKQR